MAWDRCADPTLKLEDFAGKPCWIGSDLAQVDDLAAVALLFKRNDLIYGFSRCYLPRLVVEEKARAVPEYRLWERQGLLRMTEGNMIDLDVIEADIRAYCKQFEVQQIVFDQYGAVSLASRLSSDGPPAMTQTKNAKTFTRPSRELKVG